MTFKRLNLARRILMAALMIGMVLGTFGTVYAQDADGDGIPDDQDFCPEEGDFGMGIDEFGCPIEDDVDSDGDGFVDSQDFCPFEGDAGNGVDEFGCPVGVDSDGDGLADDFDICPNQGDQGFGVDPSGCPLPAPDDGGDGNTAPNQNQNQNAGGLTATARCTADGIVAVVTNNGPAGEFEITISTASGETIFETITVGAGATEEAPPIPESFALFVGIDLILEANINNCNNAGGANNGTGGDDFEAGPAGDASVATSVSCTPDGVVVTFTNNTNQTIPGGQIQIVQEAVIDGSRATDFLPELVPGDAVSLRPSNESFRVFVNGDLATTADVNNCGDAAPQADANPGDIGTSVSCTANGVVVTFTNNGQGTIPGGQIEITQEAVIDGTRASDTLPQLAAGQSVSLRPSNESYRVFVNGDLATTANVNDCGDATTGAANPAESIGTDVQCTADGVVVSFTNNGQVAIPGNSITVIQEALRDGSRASDVLPQLAPGQSVSLRPSNESYRVYVNGTLAATADINNCTNAAAPNDAPADGDFLTLINAERARNGLNPVSYNDQLNAAARNHSQDMVDRGYFDHDAPAPAPNGVTLGERVTAAGFQWTGVAENIAGSQTTEAAVFQAWMNSPGHRANMLNGSYNLIGLGRVGDTWTLVLATGTSGDAGGNNDAGDNADAGGDAGANNNAQPRVTSSTACVDGGVQLTLTNEGNGPTRAVPVELVSASGNRIGDVLPVIPAGQNINLPVQRESFSFFVRGELLLNVDASACRNGGGVSQEQPADPPANANPPNDAPANDGVAATAGGDEFLRLINEERARNGLNPVRYNSQLNTAAQRHSQDMVDRNYFSHNAPAPSPHGVTFGERIRAAGYTYMGAAENVADGQTTEAAVFQAWMNSPGHRANMLNGSYTEIGLGRVGNKWTLVLARQ